MKKLIKRSLLIVAVFSAIVTATANDNAKLSLIGSKLVNLELKNSDGNIKVRVKDLSGVVLHIEDYDGNQFSKKYDLADLPDGNYFFEIEGETKIKKMPFSVNFNEVVFNNEVIDIFYKPTVRLKDDLIYISKVSLQKNPLKIALYNEENTLLYKENISDDSDMGKILDIASLKNGKYKLMMYCDNKTFTKEITK